MNRRQFFIMSAVLTGWTGEKCQPCKGTGEVDTVHCFASCPDCGDGELYIAALDKRKV